MVVPSVLTKHLSVAPAVVEEAEVATVAVVVATTLVEEGEAMVEVEADTVCEYSLSYILILTCLDGGGGGYGGREGGGYSGGGGRGGTL